MNKTTPARRLAIAHRLYITRALNHAPTRDRMTTADVMALCRATMHDDLIRSRVRK